MSNTNKQPKIVWAISNNAEMQKWIQVRLNKGQKWQSEREMLDNVSRAVRLIDNEGEVFRVDWNTYPTTEYIEEVMPIIKQRIDDFVKIMKDFGMGFLVGVKIPHVDCGDLENGYAVYSEDITRDDFFAIQWQYQNLEDSETTEKEFGLVSMNSVEIAI